MVCGTAGNDKDFADRADLLIGHAEFFDHNITVLNTRRQGIFYGFWLLMHLFQHKMLIAAFLCGIHIPFDVRRLLLQLLLIDIVKMKAVSGQLDNLLIFQKIDISCIFQYSRNVGCNQVSALTCTNDQRAVFTDRIHLIRMVAEQDTQCIRSLHTVHNLCDRCKRIAVIIVIQHMGNYLGICLRKELISFGHQFFL